MNRDELLKQWLKEEQESFEGWDFKHIAGRMIEDTPPWDYMARAAELMDQAESVLEMDTGGGEKFLSLRDHWPEKVVVTEGYPPNIALAKARFEPLGIQVIPMESSDFTPIPLPSDSFDLVLNRHGAYDAAEVARVLKPGGTFLYKGVHGLWAQDLLAVFGATPQWPDSTPQKYVDLLQAAGMQIVDVQDWQGDLRFTDVGAIVFYLKAIPWSVPGFTVAGYKEQLFGLQARLDAGEPLIFEARTYLIEARKPVFN